jgi:hypothetical protein
MRKGLRHIINKIKVKEESRLQGDRDGNMKLSMLSREIRNTPLIKLKPKFVNKSKELDYLHKKN